MYNSIHVYYRRSSLRKSDVHVLWQYRHAPASFYCMDMVISYDIVLAICYSKNHGPKDLPYEPSLVFRLKKAPFTADINCIWKKQ